MGLLQYILIWQPCLCYIKCKNHVLMIDVIEKDQYLCDSCEEYDKHKRNRNYKILFE